MKVAYLLNSFPVISETFILNQITGLLERGDDVHIYSQWPRGRTTKIHEDVARYNLLDRVTYDRPMARSWVRRISVALPRLIRWGWKAPATTFDCFNLVRHGRRALNLSLLYERLPVNSKPLRYDIIHCHYGPNGTRAITLRKYGALHGPIITSFHGYDVNFLPKISGPSLYYELFSAGDLFTVGSEFLRTKVVELGADPRRVVKLPMGVDLEKFRFAERTRVPQNRRVEIISVARLVEVKGIEYALRAVRSLLDSKLSVRYRVAGDGPLRQKLEDLRRELLLDDAVEFLGPVTQDEAIALYATADLFVLPSIVTAGGEEENQPVVLAEAQAAGIPVVATRVGGIPESVKDGVSGLLVPPRSSPALASALTWLISHPSSWPHMGRLGRTHVEANFSRKNLQDRLLETYRTLANPIN